MQKYSPYIVKLKVEGRLQRSVCNMNIFNRKKSGRTFSKILAWFSLKICDQIVLFIFIFKFSAADVYICEISVRRKASVYYTKHKASLDVNFPWTLMFYFIMILVSLSEHQVLIRCWSFCICLLLHVLLLLLAFIDFM